MDDNEFDTKFGNLCSKEPTKVCPECGEVCYAAEWVDIGFGPYSQQAGPYKCTSCDWVETCPYVNPATCRKCVSVDTCYTFLDKELDNG